MKIILKVGVTNLGEEGDIREVAPGYARNFLIPRGMAVMHNRAGISWFKTHHTAIEQRRQARLDEALSLKKRLEAHPIVLRMPAGEKGRLFGSVTSAVIVEMLERQAIHIERKTIEIAGAVIKTIGKYEVGVRLYGDDRATLQIHVQRDGDEQQDESADKDEQSAPAEMQTDTGNTEIGETNTADTAEDINEPIVEENNADSMSDATPDTPDTMPADSAEADSAEATTQEDSAASESHDIEHKQQPSAD